MKILVVEDEPELMKVICESLRRENYTVETADTWNLALDKVLNYEYDCIVLDIMLPGGSGLEILKELKNAGKMDSVIIVSAKNSLDDKLEGLNLGADDYLAKPFHTAELNARIKSVLRRKLQSGTNSLDIGNVSLDIDNRRLTVNYVELTLNRKEFDILLYFMMNKNRLVSKTSLAEHVWGDHADQADNYEFIYSQIKNLRKKMKDANADIEIQAVYGVGYKLNVQ